MRRLVGMIRGGKYLTGAELPPPEPKRMAPQIMVDRAPVLSPVDGSIIGCRRDAKEHCIRNDVIEVGDDQSMTRPKAAYKPVGIKDDIKDAIEQVRAGKVEPDPAPEPVDSMIGLTEVTHGG